MISGQCYGGLMLSAEKRPEDLVRVDVIRKHQIITLTRHNITPSFTLIVLKQVIVSMFSFIDCFSFF